MFDFNELMFIKYKFMADGVSSPDAYKMPTRKERDLLIKWLQKLADDDENGDFDLLMLALLETMFNNKKEIVLFLSQIVDELKDEKVKAKIESLQHKLEANIEKESKQIKNRPSYSAFNEEERLIVSRKYNYYAKFALNKSLNKIPTNITKPKSAGDFEGLSRSALVEYFDAKNFYSLGEKQQKQLYQAVVNEYCNSLGVQPCAVKFIELPFSEKTVCYGEYDPNKRVININSSVLDLLPDANGNQYLPYKILATLVHEAKHSHQFENVGKQSLSTKEQYIKNSLITNQSGLTFGQYLAEPDELDARNAAQEYFREMFEISKNQNLAAFYNLQAINENNNPKEKIPKDCERFFPEIYDSKMLDTQVNLTHDSVMYRKLIQQSLNNIYQ